MKTILKAHSFTLALLFCTNSFAGVSETNQGPGVDVQVSLSPTGSFTAKSDQIIGAVKYEKKNYVPEAISFNLKTLKTGIELRDKHMQEKYLETAKFPKAKLKSLVLKRTQFEGEIEVHGKVQKIRGVAEVKGRTLVARFKCLISRFGIKEANYMGVGVEDEVEVTARLPIHVAGVKR